MYCRSTANALASTSGSPSGFSPMPTKREDENEGIFSFAQTFH